MRTFNAKMYKRMTEIEDGNIVYSPFSLHTALSLAYLGAPEGTPTSKELIELLGLDPQHTEDYLYNYLRVLNTQNELFEKLNTNIQLANKMYVAEDLTLKPIYGAVISNFYNSSLEKLDFGKPADAAEIINSFVREKTNGIIPNIFDETSLDVLSRLVIVNAIYFKGDWLIKFDAEKTEPMEFHVDDDRKVDHPHGMKLIEAFRMAYIDELGADVLEMPYKNDYYRMLVILPAKDNDIRYVERRIGLLDVKGIDERLDIQSTNSEVDVLLPRFEANYDWMDLADSLKYLGVESIFNAEKSNLTNISDDPLYVSAIVHKAIIKVDEEGAEAAGVSGLVIDTRSSTPKSRREFKVDQPFLFYIYDHQNNVPLFVGRIVDPGGSLKLEKSVEPIIEKSVASTNCGESGYDTSQSGQDSFSLPCSGQDTFHIREQQAEQQKLRGQK